MATLALYPLSVVKTRQMLEGTKIQTPFKDVVKNVIKKTEGLKVYTRDLGRLVFEDDTFADGVFIDVGIYEERASAVREVRGGGDVLRDRGRGWWSDGIVREPDVRDTVDIISQRQQVSGLRHAFYQGRDVEPFVVGGEGERE